MFKWIKRYFGRRRTGKFITYAARKTGIDIETVAIHTRAWLNGNPDAGDPTNYGVTQEDINNIFSLFAKAQGISLSRQ